MNQLNIKTIECGRDKVINFGARRLTTNLWGVPDNEEIPLDQNCIMRYDNKFGWKWNRPSPIPFPGEHYVWPTYPSINVGTDPWGGYSTSPYLPIKIKDINSLRLMVNYKYMILPKEDMNFAYDIWITDTGQPNPSVHRQEIMIWLNRINAVTGGIYKGDIFDGYNTYEYYTRVDYNAFVIDNAPTSDCKHFIANPKKLLDHLISIGNLDPNLYVSQIDLGNEIWKGEGEINVNKFEIQLNKISL